MFFVMALVLIDICFFTAALFYFTSLIIIIDCPKTILVGSMKVTMAAVVVNFELRAPYVSSLYPPPPPKIHTLEL